MEAIQTVLPVGKQQFIREFTESFELEGSIKGYLIHLPANEQGHLQLSQIAQSLVQPDLECLHDFGFSGYFLIDIQQYFRIFSEGPIHLVIMCNTLLLN